MKSAFIMVGGPSDEQQLTRFANRVLVPLVTQNLGVSSPFVGVFTQFLESSAAYRGVTVKELCDNKSSYASVSNSFLATILKAATGTGGKGKPRDVVVCRDNSAYASARQRTLAMLPIEMTRIAVEWVDENGVSRAKQACSLGEGFDEVWQFKFSEGESGFMFDFVSGRPAEGFEVEDEEDEEASYAEEEELSDEQAA